MLLLTIVAVVAGVAAFVGVVALSISIREQNTWTLQELQALRALVERASSSALRIEVDALAADVDKLSRSTRKQFGGVWAGIEQLRAAPDEPEPGWLEGPRDETGPECRCGFCETCISRAGKLGAAHSALFSNGG